MAQEHEGMVLGSTITAALLEVDPFCMASGICGAGAMMSRVKRAFKSTLRYKEEGYPAKRLYDDVEDWATLREPPTLGMVLHAKTMDLVTADLARLRQREADSLAKQNQSVAGVVSPPSLAEVERAMEPFLPSEVAGGADRAARVFMLETLPDADLGLFSAITGSFEPTHLMEALSGVINPTWVGGPFVFEPTPLVCPQAFTTYEHPTHVVTPIHDSARWFGNACWVLSSERIKNTLLSPTNEEVKRAENDDARKTLVGISMRKRGRATRQLVQWQATLRDLEILRPALEMTRDTWLKRGLSEGHDLAKKLERLASIPRAPLTNAILSAARQRYIMTTEGQGISIPVFSLPAAPDIDGLRDPNVFEPGILFDDVDGRTPTSEMSKKDFINAMDALDILWEVTENGWLEQWRLVAAEMGWGAALTVPLTGEYLMNTAPVMQTDGRGADRVGLDALFGELLVVPRAQWRLFSLIQGEVMVNWEMSPVPVPRSSSPTEWRGMAPPVGMIPACANMGEASPARPWWLAGEARARLRAPTRLPDEYMPQSGALPVQPGDNIFASSNPIQRDSSGLWVSGATRQQVLDARVLSPLPKGADNSELRPDLVCIDNERGFAARVAIPRAVGRKYMPVQQLIVWTKAPAVDIYSTHRLRPLTRPWLKSVTTFARSVGIFGAEEKVSDG